ncbi:MAG: hypothetical protein KME26_31150 [Oscillatoria princeps RMCB-10]|nr:hypothetical protein [Oscillatoria princeps RMCB-10]
MECPPHIKPVGERKISFGSAAAGGSGLSFHRPAVGGLGLGLSPSLNVSSVPAGSNASLDAPSMRPARSATRSPAARRPKLR